MTNARYPQGWNEGRVRRVLAYYESQSDEASAVEIDAGFKRTTMEVPVGLVPVVRQLIAKRTPTRAKVSAGNRGLTGRLRHKRGL